MVNAATLQFNFNASQDVFGNDIGVQPGSYFVVDTSVIDTSTTAGTGLFDSAVTGGHVEVVDLNGPATYDSTTPASITATTDGSNTIWSIPVETGPQPAEMELIFSGTDLSTDLVDDFSIYNDAFLSGTVYTTSPLGAMNIPVASDFSVSDISEVAPVPLPPTFFLMASSLIMLMWRGNFSFASMKALMAK
jgi:hypothetical protein